MALKAIQQFQLRTVTGGEKKTRETLRLVKEAGYDGIELHCCPV
jgi:sugar phosphate isomerase/epimerase